jgi:hypothetical protein
LSAPSAQVAKESNREISLASRPGFQHYIHGVIGLIFFGAIGGVVPLIVFVINNNKNKD